MSTPMTTTIPPSTTTTTTTATTATTLAAVTGSRATQILIWLFVAFFAVVVILFGIYCFWKDRRNKDWHRMAKRQAMVRATQRKGDVTWDEVVKETDPEKRARMKTKMMRQKARKVPKWQR
eukprot:Selendium_serpulae@DN11517_c0_g1_i1.p3